jgi:MFS family permease
MGIAQDRFGARASFIISVLLQSISLFWLTTLRTTAAFFGFALLFGFTLGGYMVQFYGLTAGLFGLRSVGAINGALGTGAGIGGALGPFSAGYFFDRTASYSVPFLIAAGALLLAGLLAISLRSPSRSQHQPPNAVPGV